MTPRTRGQQVEQRPLRGLALLARGPPRCGRQQPVQQLATAGDDQGLLLGIAAQRRDRVRYRRAQAHCTQNFTVCSNVTRTLLMLMH